MKFYNQYKRLLSENEDTLDFDTVQEPVEMDKRVGQLTPQEIEFNKSKSKNQLKLAALYQYLRGITNGFANLNPLVNVDSPENQEVKGKLEEIVNDEEVNKYVRALIRYRTKNPLLTMYKVARLSLNKDPGLADKISAAIKNRLEKIDNFFTALDKRIKADEESATTGGTGNALFDKVKADMERKRKMAQLRAQAEEKWKAMNQQK